MSEIRRLLRYEIPGLAVIIHVVLVSFVFLSFEECIELLKYLGKFAAAIALLSLFIGWLAIQVFEDRCQPHRKTRGFELLHEKLKKIPPEITNECCVALLDYILRDDMYTKYPGLAETLRGYWDQFYARRIIGLGVPLVSAYTFIILLYLRGLNAISDLDIVYTFEIAKHVFPMLYHIYIFYISLTLSVTQTAFQWSYITFLTFYNIILYHTLWIKSDRIFKEVECQEYLFILDNINKLNDEKFNPFLRADLDRQDPP